MTTTENLLLGYFKDLSSRSDFPVSDIKLKVALVSTPRCGSSMFCSVLQNTAQMGLPLEWFNMRYMQAYLQHMQLGTNLDIPSYLDFIMRKSTSDNGIFTVNFHVEQYMELLKRGLDVFSLGFDKVYYLHRQDKIAQAYSLLKAAMTDQWSAGTTAKNTFDENRIWSSQLLECLLNLSRQEDVYQEKIQAKTNREFAYEDFRDISRSSAYQKILKDCGVEEEIDFSTSLSRQGGSREPKAVSAFKHWLGLEHD